MNTRISGSSAYLIDAYAWVEYARGTKKGDALRKLLSDKKNTFYTLEANLAEIKGWCLKEETNFDAIYAGIRADSEIKPVSLEDWLDAAGIRHEKRAIGFGMIDALLLAKQKTLAAQIITGDKHFKGMESVVYIGD